MGSGVGGSDFFLRLGFGWATDDRPEPELVIPNRSAAMAEAASSATSMVGTAYPRGGLQGRPPAVCHARVVLRSATASEAGSLSREVPGVVAIDAVVV